jgi:hypothetical protein
MTNNNELTTSKSKQRLLRGEYSYILTLFFNPTGYTASNGEDNREKCGRKHINSTVLLALPGENEIGHKTCKDS